MPLLESRYKAPAYLFNKHLETIVPNSFRKLTALQYTRERLELPDGDFIDLDWLKHPQPKQILVVSHGLEGNSSRPYIAGISRYFYSRGWDVLAWNCRSCSGELNRTNRFYHHGDTGDLRYLMQTKIFDNDSYQLAGLTGFSMGGSITLKYLGEEGLKLDPARIKAAVFSVPCNLGDSARALGSWDNTIYRKRFMKKLYVKLQEKQKRNPDLPIDLSSMKSIRTFPDFDSCFTAPLHGFKDSEDFYNQSSALHYLQDIRVPTLLVNAQNDPMLPPSCSPKDIARYHPFLYLETPARGGHVGFSQGRNNPTYAEERAWEFIAQQ
jgi:predicted alpha/beta-fold hydrolase